MTELGHIAQFRNGLNYSKDNFGTGLKVINVKDFGDRSVADYESLGEICPDGIAREESLLKEGDILFVRSNGNRELIGRSMMLRCIPSAPLSHSAFTIRARFHSDLVFPRFYAYLFRSQLIRSVLSAQGNGANISNLNQDILSKLQVPVPDLPTQCRIASILSAYDDLIENNTRRIAILEEMARRLYEEWFVRFRFPGHEQVRMVESEFGVIPEGWNVIRIGAAFTTVLGGTPSRGKPEYWDGGTVPWINSGKVNELRVLEPSELITDLALKKAATKLMPRGTTLLAITGATLGQVSILCEEMCANQSVVGIVDPTGFHSEYIYRTIQARIPEIILHASGGAQQHINKEVVNDVLVLQPDIETLQAFNVIAVPTGKMISTLMKKNINLRAQRDLLLPKLISGEIDVSSIPEAEAVAA